MTGRRRALDWVLLMEAAAPYGDMINLLAHHGPLAAAFGIQGLTSALIAITGLLTLRETGEAHKATAGARRTARLTAAQKRIDSRPTLPLRLTCPHGYAGLPLARHNHPLHRSGDRHRKDRRARLPHSTHHRRVLRVLKQVAKAHLRVKVKTRAQGLRPTARRFRSSVTGGRGGSSPRSASLR
ncbi:DUF4267 domain-containing protein [Amycolatopsis sp. NPDC021455]|uniref:DUF4267 domain-containing protein n=1 Tax=Amycolatopsis sp. NPDC021455 TaxID=3154901 RepID=UPI0033CB2615